MDVIATRPDFVTARTPERWRSTQASAGGVRGHDMPWPAQSSTLFTQVFP